MTHPQGPDPWGTENAGPPASEEQTAQVQMPALPNMPTASPSATFAQPWWPAPTAETPAPAQHEPTPAQSTAGAWPWAPSDNPSQSDGAVAEPAPQHTTLPHYGPPAEHHHVGYSPAPPSATGQPGMYYGGAQTGFPQQPTMAATGSLSGITPRPAKASSRSVRTIGAVVGAVLVLAALVGVLGFWKPGYFRSVQLSVSAAQTGVQQVLTDAKTGYGIANVRNVTCNGGTNPVVKKNATFDCEVTIDGAKRRVTATFADDNGSYQVGEPK